ncbi:expressed protein [Chlorella variabilis]|uniref:Expressed protein n=1 Tax=Chlorella variabilis TaxID=554065 RepID=E1Z3R7_CHLVA|nr:expressed protein [Chlorella variabilis]EFN59222.1 expressed protein [Chlorella variabilis]|eukprot:XP_005851324.1 expressed protein [Chlorella variabilis]
MRDLRGDEFDSNQILGGEWTPTLSWTLPTTRVANTSQHTTLPRGHADEEDSFEPGNVLGGEWDARSCSLASYDDVLEHFYSMKHPKKSSN